MHVMENGEAELLRNKRAEGAGGNVSMEGKIVYCVSGGVESGAVEIALLWWWMLLAMMICCCCYCCCDLVCSPTECHNTSMHSCTHVILILSPPKKIIILIRFVVVVHLFLSK